MSNLIEPSNQLQIIKVSNNFDFTSLCTKIEVTRIENKIDNAVLTIANDIIGDNTLLSLLDISIGDIIQIISKDSTIAQPLIFQGQLVSRNPDITEKGSFMKLQFYAYPAIGLNRMRATEIYNDVTIRQVLAKSLVASSTDFPFFEWYTENEPSDPTTEDWFIHTIPPNGTGTIYCVSTFPSGTVGYFNYNAILSPAVGVNFIVLTGAVDFGILNMNYEFPSGSAIHYSPNPFILDIDDWTIPKFNSITRTWNEIPYIDFWLNRQDNGANIELQLKVSDNNYIRLQLTDQDHGSDNLNVIANDNIWHHIQIPIGSKWGEALIYVDGKYLVSDIGGTPKFDGETISDRVGWSKPTSQSTGSASFVSWNEITAINFYLTSGDIALGVDGLILCTYDSNGNSIPLTNNFSLIPDNVNKEFHTTSTIYNINTDFIVNDLTNLLYLKFTYEQVTKCLMDTLNLHTATVYPSIGLHWIVTPDGKLCIAEVGNHNVEGIDSSHIVESVWATNSGRTITLGSDYIASNFEQKEPEANFVIISGMFEYPPLNEWCANLGIINCNSSAQPPETVGEWYQIARHNIPTGQTWSDDKLVRTGDCIIGPYGLAIDPVYRASSEVAGASTDKFWITLPDQLYDDNILNPNLISDIHLTFWMKTAVLGGFELRVYTDLYNVPSDGNDDGYGNYFWVLPQLGNDGSWTKFDFVLGPEGNWNITNDATWSKTIKRIEFRFIGAAYSPITSQNGYVYLDGLNVNGQTIKAGIASNSINQYGTKMKLLNESLVSGYLLTSSLPHIRYDPLDYLCMQEVMRDSLTPWVGTVTIEMDANLMAGQMISINSPAFNGNKQFRILWLKHTCSGNGSNGSFTTIYMTDDLINSYARDPSNLETLAIKAVNPDYQNRDYARLKVLGISNTTQIVRIIDIDNLT